MAQVLRTPQANLDLLEIWTHVARTDAHAADRLLETIDQQCDRLADFPQMGRRRDDLAPSMRSFPAESYVIFYREIPNGIEVIRVLHGARNIDALFQP